MRWVVKLGGSLERNPLLQEWLASIVRDGRGKVAIVPGGGSFADAARAAQAHWKVDDVSAHNMAVLGMAQSAQLMKGLCPELECGADIDAVRAALDRGRAAIWMPLDLLRGAPDAFTNWHTTSDSLALHLAEQLPTERLLLVKSCAIPAGADFTALAAAGIVDARFPQAATGSKVRIELWEAAEVGRLARAIAIRG